MWENPRHAGPGRDRPIEPWFTETGAERGSSRPGLPKPGQLFGAIEPVLTVRPFLRWFIRNGTQPCIPTVSLGVTSAVVCTYGCDDGRIGPTRCAIIDAGLDGRCRPRQASKRPPAKADSARICSGPQ